MEGAVSTGVELPPLREELVLHPGARFGEGAPTWTLQDPVSNRFFRLNWMEFEILSRWHMGATDTMLDAIAEQTTLRPESEDVDSLLRFLATHNLLQVRGGQALERLLEQARRLQKRGFGWLLKNYLFIRFPLVSPQRFLDATAPRLDWVWSRAFAVLTTLAGVLGIILVIRQWESFAGTFLYFFSWEGVLLMLVALTGAKVLHELGHAYTAHRFGCRVPTMGVALLVMWPVLYTDATDTWKLASRTARMRVAAAGMVWEIALAAWATLLWSFLPDGALRSAAFLLATSTWILTLLVNLNPLMRFDGYYLLSDMLGVPNLQERAFALGRWRLREFLFGFGESAPEYHPPYRVRALLVYAYATWIYRFFLFLGIALLVYYFFFKALGVLLMAVELAWFIGKPVYSEVKEWLARTGSLRLNRQTLRTGMFLSAALILLILPWQGHVSAPALWRSAEFARIFVPSAGRVDVINIQPGMRVSEGDELFRIAAPDLDYEIAQGRKKLESLQWQVSFQSLDQRLLQRSEVLWQEMQAEAAAQAARLQERDRLSVTTNISGVIAEILSPLSVGDWVAGDSMLGLVVNDEVGRLEAWVAEETLSQLQLGQNGMFYPADLGRAPMPITIVGIDDASTRMLSEFYLASDYGGPIAARPDADGNLVPERPIYRVQAEPLNGQTPWGQVVTGTARFDGERRSILGRIVRRIGSILIRESGF